MPCGRHDSELREGLSDQFAVTEAAVVRHEFAVGGEQARQKLTEIEIGGRAIVDGPDRHLQKLSSRLGAFLDHCRQVVAPTIESPEMRNAGGPQLHKGPDDGGHHDFAAAMLLGHVGGVENVRVRFQLDRLAQRASPGTTGHADLGADPQQDRVPDSPGSDLVLGDEGQGLSETGQLVGDAKSGGDHLGQREDGEDRDNVREAFMEGGLIGSGGFGIARAQAIEDRVGRLMRHDIMTERGEDRLARLIEEIAEHQGPVGLGVEGIGQCEGVGRDVELVPTRRPTDSPAQGTLEKPQRAHRDRIAILGMEIRVGDDARLIVPV